MAAPSRAQMPPAKPSRSNSGNYEGNLTINTDANGQRLSTQSRQNRYSTQTDAPTVSTESPFVSPIASSFRAEGLAPRPPSFAYAGGDPTKEFQDRRQRRKSQGRDQSFDDNIPPPAAPDAPRPGPPLSYKLPYKNQAAARRGSTRNPESPISPGEGPEEYFRDGGEYRASQRKGSRVGDIDDRGELDREAQSYSRRGSNAEAEAQRRREWAPDKSPLQRLERTLGSITKEEKRARVEEAELLAREAKAGRGGDRAAQNSVRFRNRPVAKSQASGSQPEPQTLADAGLVRSLSSKQKDQLQRSGTVERRRPDPTNVPLGEASRGSDYQPQQGQKQQSDPTQRRPSTLERSAIPAGAAAIAAAGALAGLSRSENNRLQKEPAGDSQFSRGQSNEKQFQEGSVLRKPAAGGDRQRAGAGAGASRGVAFNDDPKISREKELPLVRTDTNATDRSYEDDSGDEIDVIPVRRNNSRKLEQLTGQKQPLDDQQLDVGRSTTLRQPGIPRLVTLDVITKATDLPMGNGGAPAPAVYVPSKRLDEWKKGGAVLLDGAILDIDTLDRTDSQKDKTWWEAGNAGRRRGSSSKRRAEAYDGEYDDSNGTVPQVRLPYSAGNREVYISKRQRDACRPPGGGRLLRDEIKGPVRIKASMQTKSDRSKPAISHLPSSTSSLSSRQPHTSKTNLLTRRIRVLPDIAPTKFKPPLFLKSGPLLRYCGLRRERRMGRFPPDVPRPEREIWRGSVMIVTEDSRSSYELAPTLRLFVQPMDLLSPPPAHVAGDAGELAPEYVDPIAGLPKVGRDGRTLYVRPVDHLKEMRDLSTEESDIGLFESQKSSLDSSADSRKPTPQKSQFDGEKAGKYKEIRGFRLHAEHGVTFWKFNLEIELRAKQQRIAYRINRGPATGFWVPARDEAMNIMFHSCNGFSSGVDTHQFSGPDPMWRDVLNTHQTRPFHVMLGGGDQIYNDRVQEDAILFKQWTEITDRHVKEQMPFTAELQNELELFYLNRYSMWFSQGLFGLAISQIPMVNIFDDHDLIDGWGSYPDSYMKSPVMSGLGAVAFKYYMLFQHQSSIDEGEETEPSWILGAQPGPYIPELSRSIFTHLGRSVAFLGLDCRTERTYNEVLSPETYDIVLDRLHKTIIKGETKHLIVLLGVPIAYPRMVWLENILTSRLMNPVKALSRTGMLGKGLLNRLDGGVEILDDLDDHWTARHHKDERAFLLAELQDLAAEKSVRITFLGGDVHLAAVGQFYSNPKLNVLKHHDHRYMLNIISSAIVNTPPPDTVADLLNRRDKVHHLDAHTDEDMIPIFPRDVDGKPRNNKKLLNRRNWCSIRVYDPDLTPPPTPEGFRSPSPPPKSGNLFRRLSSTRRPRNRPDGDSNDDGSRPPLSSANFFSRRPSFSRRATTDSQNPDDSRPPTSSGSFFSRRPSLSRRATTDSQNPDGSRPPTSSGSFFNRRPSLSGRPSTDSQGPGVLTRTLSLTRKDFLPGTLFRRNSKKKPDDGGINGYGAESDDDAQYSQQPRPSGIRGGGIEDEEPYFPGTPTPLGRTPPQAVQKAGTPITGPQAEPDPAKFKFYRTPTFQSQKQRKAGGGAVNLEGGLEICLNVEVNSKDPAGITTPYRLLVPRLWHDEPEATQEQPAQGTQTGLKRWVSLKRKNTTGGAAKKWSAPPSAEQVQGAEGNA